MKTTQAARPLPKRATRSFTAASRRAYSLLETDNTLCASSPLVATEQQIDRAVALFIESVVEVGRELPHAA